MATLPANAGRFRNSTSLFTVRAHGLKTSTADAVRKQLKLSWNAADAASHPRGYEFVAIAPLLCAAANVDEAACVRYITVYLIDGRAPALTTIVTESPATIHRHDSRHNIKTLSMANAGHMVRVSIYRYIENVFDRQRGE